MSHESKTEIIVAYALAWNAHIFIPPVIRKAHYYYSKAISVPLTPSMEEYNQEIEFNILLKLK
jgi:hypothetical protein